MKIGDVVLINCVVVDVGKETDDPRYITIETAAEAAGGGKSRFAVIESQISELTLEESTDEDNDEVVK